MAIFATLPQCLVYAQVAMQTCIMTIPTTDQNFNQHQGHFNPQACMQQVNHHGNHGDHHHHHHHHHYHQQQPQPQQQQQQQQHQEMYDFSKVDLDNSTPASFFNASLPAIVPETTPGSYSNTEDWSIADEFSFLPFHPGNLIEEAVGSNSNTTSLSSGRKQKLDASDKPFKFPPMSRQDKVQRYFEKKKTRKYEKKLMKYSSRRTYAQTRPRIRGRFARRSQVDAQ
ncbi:unnamed protein product [Lactuca saligna]|uniref:CCT domain-containing protein n=1 Tax=Lactuca saligna TaxID=75948 RepID=A0AA35Z1Z5_LACSI|nr:unnamed protein product [Lactuca saligna]